MDIFGNERERLSDNSEKDLRRWGSTNSGFSKRIFLGYLMILLLHQGQYDFPYQFNLIPTPMEQNFDFRILFQGKDSQVEFPNPTLSLRTLSNVVHLEKYFAPRDDDNIGSAVD